MVRHVLAVLPTDGSDVVLVALAGEPADHRGLEDAAGVPLTPAGPPLAGPAVVLHRYRGRRPRGRRPAVAAAGLGELLDRVLAEESGETPAARAPWCRPGWAEDTDHWLDGVLADLDRVRTGPVQVHATWALSHVLRVPTRGGPLWLKACAPHFAVEPGVTGWLSDRAAGAVPDVLALDVPRGLLLMSPLTGEEATPADLPAVAARVAELQVAAVPDRAGLLALGLVDRGPAATAARFAEVALAGLELPLLDPDVRRQLAAAVPWVADSCAALDAVGLPPTLSHGDLHLGNVVRAPRGPVVYDWSDACLGNPLLDVVHLPTVGSGHPADRAWLRPWADGWQTGWDDAALSRAVDLAVVVDRAFQAVTYEDLQRALEPDARTVLHGVQARVLTRVAELAGAAGVS